MFPFEELQCRRRLFYTHNYWCSGCQPVVLFVCALSLANAECKARKQHVLFLFIIWYDSDARVWIARDVLTMEADDLQFTRWSWVHVHWHGKYKLRIFNWACFFPRRSEWAWRDNGGESLSHSLSHSLTQSWDITLASAITLVWPAPWLPNLVCMLGMVTPRSLLILGCKGQRSRSLGSNL